MGPRLSLHAQNLTTVSDCWRQVLAIDLFKLFMMKTVIQLYCRIGEKIEFEPTIE